MSHGGGGHERWLISYADFITLLMVLFVVLYSMANVDMAKYKLLADSLNRAFGGSGSMVDLVGEMQPARLAAISRRSGKSVTKSVTAAFNGSCLMGPTYEGGNDIPQWPATTKRKGTPEQVQKNHGNPKSPTLRTSCHP